MDILDVIPFGHSNAIRRRELAVKLGATDRLARRKAARAILKKRGQKV